MKIAVLLSGGVDSSVALCQLAECGRYDITAFYLKIWLEDELASLGQCPWEDDIAYARDVCERYNIPLEIVPLQSEYLDRVVSYTIAELRAGRTPSPDILCNQRIKYGAFLDRIDASYQKVASGHYANVIEQNGSYELTRAKDPIKDQTYFLSHLSQDQLSRCLFPLGNYLKSEVRELAAQYNLPNKDRADSQGICFLGKIKFNEFVRFHLGENPGPIKELGSDQILGQHKGLWFHTIGQRKGLNLSGGPWFVVDKDMRTNTLYVSHEECIEHHGRQTFTLKGPHWISSEPKTNELGVKIRHGAQIYRCQIEQQKTDTLSITLDKADRGIAPGQFAVFYDKDICLGGGVIH